MKAYLIPNAPVGYGPRIFIPYAHHDAGVEGFMRKNSMWGGHDKDTGKCYGYEFPSILPGMYDEPEFKERFEKAKRYLLVRGFKLEEQGEKNAGEIWK